MPDIRLVCFDLGGVLVRICRTWNEACAAAAVPCSLRAGTALEDLDCLLKLQMGRLDDTEYVDALAASLGVPAADAERAHDAILCHPYPGTESLIDELHARSMTTACLSNTNGLHWKVLRDPARFRGIASLHLALASHELRMYKPDAEIYLELERIAGSSGPEIVFFDDSKANVEAAVRQGWRAYLIDHDADPARQMREALSLLAPSSR